jgi:hypothetical protein
MTRNRLDRHGDPERSEGEAIHLYAIRNRWIALSLRSSQ